MSQLNPKSEHRILYPAFDGGINLSVPPESLARNELMDAVNVEYSARTGAMTVRGGLMRRKVSIVTAEGSEEADIYDIENVCALKEWGSVIVRTVGKKIYWVDFRYGETVRYELDLPGYLPWEHDAPIYALYFDEYYLLTCGHLMYKLNESGKIERIAIPDDPDNGRPHILFPEQLIFRAGRAGVVDGDRLIFSAVGDSLDWDAWKSGSTASDAQYIEIGYKDGLEIASVEPMLQDLIVFKSEYWSKSEGKIYRISGNYPDWTVSQITATEGTYSPETVRVCGNDIYYLTQGGLKRLSTVVEYGEVKTSQPDRKVNAELITELTPTARMWHIPHKSQLWIQASSRNARIWIYDYGLGIWTKYEFPDAPVSVESINGKVYVFMRDGIYEQDESCEYDESADGTRQAVNGYMQLGTLTYGWQILLKGCYAEHALSPNGTGELSAGKFRMEFKGTSSRRKCIVRGWTITPEVRLTCGGSRVSLIGFQTAEI